LPRAAVGACDPPRPATWVGGKAQRIPWGYHGDTMGIAWDSGIGF
jgi:hypothetical protein